MKPYTLISAASLFLIFSFNTKPLAQEMQMPCDILEDEVLEKIAPDTVELITAFIPAQTIERVPPRYPRRAAKAGAEGWVQMSYVIDTQGKVQDAVVEDFGGHQTFKRAALKAIEKWTFSPAIKDGEPTEQCHQAVQFNFTLNGNNGASKRFISRYKEADELIKAKDFAGAQAIIAKLHENKDLNRYENSWLWNIDATLANELGNIKREIKSINRTLASSESHVDDNKTFDDAYIGFLYSRLFGLEAQAGRFGAALKTLEAIKELPDAELYLKAIDKTVTQLTEFLASDQHLFVKVDLQNSGRYFHELARNKFAFANINGKVDTVEVRCETRRERFTVAEDFVWSIPASWGECRVMVKGDSQTTFELVEISNI